MRPTVSRIRTADMAGIDEAAALLRRGGLVALPTETVYGLAADATDNQAVARIFEAKGRPRFNPLISHFREQEEVEAQAELSAPALKLAQACWPGPLTLVLPRGPNCTISDLASAGLPTIAARVPAHPVAHAVLRQCGCPLAAPSANRAGRISPTSAAAVAEELGDRVDLILNGGACLIGVESTVVSVIGDTATLLRPGGVTREFIEGVIGPLAEGALEAERPSSPGQLASHYAPDSAVRLDADAPRAGERYLGFGDCARADMNLSITGDLREAAANLFAMLRALDAGPGQSIAVAPIPEHGLGLAINDRLRRAAADRSAA